MMRSSLVHVHDRTLFYKIKRLCILAMDIVTEVHNYLSFTPKLWLITWPLKLLVEF